MRTKAIGVLTGLFLGVGFLAILPSAAQAASWSTYASGSYSSSARPQSSAGTILYDKLKIDPPSAQTAFFRQKGTVVVNATKGKILENQSSQSGTILQIVVISPQSNTVGRCELTPLPGAGSGTGTFFCQAYK